MEAAAEATAAESAATEATAAAAAAANERDAAVCLTLERAAVQNGRACCRGLHYQRQTECCDCGDRCGS
jgi:hypothetical protein